MKLVLNEPEIPPNTGNVARLCAAFNVELHLVGPLGFSLDNRHLKRAGLDYWPNVRLSFWPCWNDFQNSVSKDERLVFATSHGSSLLQHFRFQADDIIIMGSETKGLPAHILALSPFKVRIPFRSMNHKGVRCLNLSTAAGIFIFSALNSCHLLDNID